MNAQCLQEPVIPSGYKVFLDTWIEDRHCLALLYREQADMLSDGLGEFPDFNVVEVAENGTCAPLTDPRLAGLINDILDTRIQALEESLMGDLS